MDLQDAIKVLDYHQRWRQGIEEDMKYKPLQLTEALDIVLEQVKKLNIDDVSKCCIEPKLTTDFFTDNETCQNCGTQKKNVC